MPQQTRPRRVTPVDHDPEELRRERIRKGWSQADLARWADIQPSIISEMEAMPPTRGMSPRNRLRISRALGRELAILRRGEQQEAA